MSYAVIKTNFGKDLAEITVRTPGMEKGERTEFRMVSRSVGYVSLVTSQIQNRTNEIIKYKGDSIIEY